MTERTFEVLEHTADKGVAATGRTMAEAFENAAYGMFSLFVDPGAYQPTSQREVTVNADDREQLLWAWLSELMFIFEVDRELPVDFRVVEIINGTGHDVPSHQLRVPSHQLRANVSVRPIGDDIEWLGAPVKAVTFHQLKVEQTDDSWYVQVYVDV